MSKPLYFLDTTPAGLNSPLTTSFVFYGFLFPCRNQIIIAPEYTNTDSIFFSFDGITTHGRLLPQDAALNLTNKRNTGIWLKGNSGSQNVRVWAQ